MPWVPILLGLVVLVIAAGVIGSRDRPQPTMAQPASPPARRPSSPAAGEVAEVHTPAAPPAPAPAPTEAPPIAVTAEQLRKDYKANEISADEHYRGRILEVSGTVEAIRKDFLDKPVVEFETTEMFEMVDAHFAKSQAGQLRNLSRGSQVTVRCTGNNVVMSRPQLKDCVLE